ncbi:MAG TPA: NAD(P)-dependent oxidoreductase [Casimicrobiaceae bacterium]|nr:NAD(P)-dependent oxidoreductase [Casimicrobiaceae bacterium]
MHVLVTGSTGRIGRRVVMLLLDRGDSVTGFDANSARLDHPRYREVVGRFEDERACTEAVRGAQAICHLGAYMSWLPGDAARVYASNATGTFELLQAAARCDVRRFVLASTGEVYPESRARYSPVDEDHPCEPRSIYGLSKLLAEETTRLFARTTAIETVILRFAHTQDADELLDPTSFFSGPRFYLQAKIRQQRELGNSGALAVLEALDDGVPKHVVQCNEAGRPYRMMIADARDMAIGVVRALDVAEAAGGAFNLGPDDPVRFDHAVALLAEVSRLPVVQARLPGPPVDYATSNALARDVLGFRPAWSFDRMVADAAQRFQRNASA